MSIEFASKDLTRKWFQTVSYLKFISIITAFCIFIIYMFYGLGFVVLPEAQNLFNYTTFDLYSQYYQFIILASIILCIIWIIVINHTILNHKTKDLAIMKAVGTLRKKLNSYFMTELLIIDLIGLILGIAIGFIGYLIIFFVFSFMGYEFYIFFDFFFTPIIIILSLLFSFIINGLELNEISRKRYSEISSGDIHNGYIAVGGLRMVPKIISKIGFKMKIAVTNLTRKKRSFNRILIMIALSLTVLITTLTGTLVMSNTIRTQISGAQGNSTIIIGHRDVINNYSLRYEEFSSSSLSFLNTENFTESKYLMNEIFIDQFEENIANNVEQFGEIEYLDKRIFMYEYAYEKNGILITSDDEGTSYQPVGEERESIIPIVGLEFKDYIENWQVTGTINQTDSYCAVIGDTLANDFFEAATYQKLELENGGLYEISGVFYDPFCAGNATYVSLNSIQEDYNLNGSINLITIGVSPEIDHTNLIENLENVIQNEYSDDFIVADLTEIFEQNIISIDILIFISMIIAFLLFILIIYALKFFQDANFQEKAKDYSVIRAIGGKAKLIKDIMFYEDLMIILISMGIALGFSLIFNNIFLLGQNAILPSIFEVLSVWLIISGLIIVFAYISIKIRFKMLVKNELQYLRVFER